MPKLYGDVESFYKGKKIDKENDDVMYFDDTHEYIGKSDGNKYISVTTLIHEFCEKFDEEFWASYKACEWLLGPEFFMSLKSTLLKTKKFKDSYLKEYGIDVDSFNIKKNEIIKEYELKRNAATSRGTAIHSEKENLFYSGDENHIKKYCGGGVIPVKKGYYKLDVDRAILPEFLVSYKFDDYLCVSGQIDLLIKDGNDIIIRDWKTNDHIDFKSFFDRSSKKYKMMLGPLSNLMDCSFVHYQLQLSTYAYILQKINPKYKIKSLSIIHIDHDGNEYEYECEYLKEDVARMLLYYRKKNKIKMELDKDKPIIF